jgi:predicted DCC family thiol-disulfide oxidoreductase YuxK
VQRLYVLYDDRCGLCRWCRRWVEGQPKFIEVVFVSAWSDKARALFPGLSLDDPPEELLAVSDEGGVYRGGSAWVMVLYCLTEYREWSLRLASTVLLPLARQAFDLLSKHRGVVSSVLHLANDDETIGEALRLVRQAACDLSSTTATAPDLQGPPTGANGSPAVPAPAPQG